MNMLGWCMWQGMHWLVGIARVNSCRRGWPGSSFGIVGSAETDSPVWPCSA